MFRIHQEQVSKFDEIAKADYRGRLVAYLSAEFPECFDEMQPAQIEAWTGQAIDKAEHHGIATEPEATQTVLLFLLLGLFADESLPWFGEILRRDDLYAVGKVRLLLEAARSNGIAGIERMDLGLTSPENS